MNDLIAKTVPEHGLFTVTGRMEGCQISMKSLGEVIEFIYIEINGEQFKSVSALPAVAGKIKNRTGEEVTLYLRKFMGKLFLRGIEVNGRLYLGDHQAKTKLQRTFLMMLAFIGFGVTGVLVNQPALFLMGVILFGNALLYFAIGLFKRSNLFVAYADHKAAVNMAKFNNIAVVLV